MRCAGTDSTFLNAKEGSRSTSLCDGCDVLDGLPTATVVRKAAGVERPRLETAAVETSTVNRADDRLATIERLVPVNAVPTVMASLDMNGSHIMEAGTIAASVEAIVFGVPNRSARHTTDQTADGGTSNGSIAASSDETTDDGPGDGSIASTALGEVLGVDVRCHHENGCDCKDSVFDLVHCFHFREKL